MAWTCVGVKSDVKKIIDEIAKRRGMKKCEVVEVAVRQLLKEQKYKRGEKEYHWGYDIDRPLWYAFKLANSVAQLKTIVELNGDEKGDEKKINEYRNMTMNTINQIEERLGVDLDNVKRAIDRFLKTPNGRMKAYLNDETKVAMARILFQ